MLIKLYICVRACVCVYFLPSLQLLSSDLLPSSHVTQHVGTTVTDMQSQTEEVKARVNNSLADRCEERSASTQLHAGKCE